MLVRLPKTETFEKRLQGPAPMAFSCRLAYHTSMQLLERTVRQRMIDLLTETRLSSYQLAQLLTIPERRVEEHLPHVVKSLAHDRTRRFVLDPASCSDCGFLFRNRTKLTKPSRCPTCRSEAVTAPRYGIDSVTR